MWRKLLLRFLVLWWSRLTKTNIRIQNTDKDEKNNMNLLEEYGRPYKEYKGTGKLHDSVGADFPVNFTCIQLNDSSIYIYATHSSTYPLPSQPPEDEFLTSLSGHLDDGRSFETLGNMSLIQSSHSSEGSQAQLNYVFNVDSFEIKNVTSLISQKPQYLRFALTNFKFYGTSLSKKPGSGGQFRSLNLTIGGHNIIILQESDYDESVRLLSKTKTCRVSSYLYIEYNGNSFSALESIINDLCILLSFANGTIICSLNYEELDGSGKVLKTHHRYMSTSIYGDLGFIAYNDPTLLKNFIETIYPTYANINPIYRLDQIIDTVVIAKLNKDFAELEGLKVSSIVDVLSKRWKQIQKKNLALKQA